MATQTEGDRKLAPRRARGQSGFTLLEAIVSLALVSTVILALAAGLLTTVKSSTSARETQEADAALSAYAEQQKATFPDTCPDPSSTLVLGYDAAVLGVESSDGVGGWSPCNEESDNPPYRLSIQVSSGTESATGQVVVGSR